jgi:hypothetical protein
MRTFRRAAYIGNLVRAREAAALILRRAAPGTALT